MRERVVRHRADLVVVDPVGNDHRERREDARIGQALDGSRLHLPQVLAAVEQVRLELEAVELEVDLDAVAKPMQGVEEPVVLRDADAIRVEQHARHAPLDGGLDDLDDLRVHRRLAAGEHQHVDLAALALDRGVERAEDVRQARVSAHVRARCGEAGRAVEIAVLGDVHEQDARVLRLEPAQAIGVAHRDRHHVVRRVLDDLARRDAPLLEVLPEAVVLVVQADHLAVAAPAVPPQVDRSVLHDEVALEDVGRVVDLAVGVLGEAVPADGEDHAERRVRAERKCGGHDSQLQVIVPEIGSASERSIGCPCSSNASAGRKPSKVSEPLVELEPGSSSIPALGPVLG